MAGTAFDNVIFGLCFDTSNKVQLRAIWALVTGSTGGDVNMVVLSHRYFSTRNNSLTLEKRKNETSASRQTATQCNAGGRPTAVK